MRWLANVTTRMLLAVVSPMHISVPISAGTLRCVCVRNSIHMTPRQRKRHRHQHDQRIQPALEVDHQQQVHQHHRQRHAGEQAVVALAHGLDLAAQRHVIALQAAG